MQQLTDMLKRERVEDNETNDRLTAALAYAKKRGWPVIPLVSDKNILGGHLNVSEFGMNPRASYRLGEATLDPEKIHEYWERWPGANVGVLTGRSSGLLVLNIAPALGENKKGGQEYVDFLNRHYGTAASPIVIEGINGIKHQLFAYPGWPDETEDVPCGKFGSSLTLSGHGGYWVAPPHQAASYSPIQGGFFQMALSPFCRQISACSSHRLHCGSAFCSGKN